MEVLMKESSFITMKLTRIAFLLSPIFLTLFSGCINRPVLLRNRQNVPPPAIEPSDEYPSEDVDIIDSSPLVIIPVPLTPPPPLDIKTAPIVYKVQKRDSFWKVAWMYGITKEELAACNNLSLDKPLPVGIELLIPPGGEFIPVDKRPKSKSVSKPPKRATPKADKVEYTPSTDDGTYTVVSGDYLGKIAKKFKITTPLLVKANNLDIRKPIKPGMKLIIPGRGEKIQDPVDVDIKGTDLIDNIPPAGDSSETLLDDALKGAGDDKSAVDDSRGDAVDVIDELDKAVSIAEDTEIPGALYTEEVLPNDTLQQIAEKYGVTPEAIMAVNPDIPADGKLRPFTSIKIPNKR